MTTVHDTLFKDIYVNVRFATDIFRKVLSPRQFRLFDWKTLEPQATVFVDHEGRQKMADLVFSVKTKRTGKTADLVLLVEHKSYRNDGHLQQILEYQTVLYAKRKNPIIPILVYQGGDKAWKPKLNFQDSLVGMTRTIEEEFGGDILGFRCRLLDLRSLKSWSDGDLTTGPILFILGSIWRMNRRTLKEFMELCENVKDKRTGEILLNKGLDYVHNFKPEKFTWKWIEKIAKESLNEGNCYPLSFSYLHYARVTAANWG